MKILEDLLKMKDETQPLTIQEKILTIDITDCEVFTQQDTMTTEDIVNAFDTARQLTLDYLEINKQIEKLLIDQKELRGKLQEKRTEIMNISKTL